VSSGRQVSSALVEGIENLSPIQPCGRAECEFVIDDVEDPWTYPPDHFDLVHLRVLVAHMKDIQTSSNNLSSKSHLS